MNAVFDPREDPGKKASAAFAALVHIALAALLIYGIRWQTRSPEAVEVELVRAVPAAPAAVAPPLPQPQPAPPPKIEPKLEPKLIPKPEPKVEPKPAPPKPDIALKEKEKPKPKPKPKPEPKPEPKPQPKVEQKPEPDKASRQLMADAMKREQQQIEARKAGHELAQLKATQAASARSKSAADYIGKIKGNIVLPPDIQGNPEAIFDVVQLPSGEILSVKLRKSSGHAAYDNAVERAILKSSPLPRPEQGDLFSRSLELKFRPLEE